MSLSVEKDVSCLDVSMDLSHEVQVFKTLQCGLQDGCNLILCQLGWEEKKLGWGKFQKFLQCLHKQKTRKKPLNRADKIIYITYHTMVHFANKQQRRLLPIHRILYINTTIILLHYTCIPLLGTHRLITQSDDVRDRAGSTVLHDNPQVCVLEVAAIVLHYIRARRKRKRSGYQKRTQSSTDN